MLLDSEWLVPYFSPVILSKIKRVSKYYFEKITWKTINFSIIDHIHKRLRHVLGVQYNTFIKYISTHDIVISGSFIIQCILDEYNANSDIDLYSFHQTEKDEIATQSITSSSTDFEPFCDIIDKSLLGPDDYCQTHISNPYNKPFIIKVIDIIQDEFTLQNVQLSVESIAEFKMYMLQYFDMDIGRNLFAIVDNKPVLHIGKFSAIINKRAEMSISDYLWDKQQIMVRANKYNKRGFAIDFGPNPSVNIITVNKQNYPLLVFKLDEEKHLENFTFLDMVWNNYGNENDSNKVNHNSVKVYDLRGNGSYIINISDKQIEKKISKPVKCDDECFFNRYYKLQDHRHIVCSVEYYIADSYIPLPRIEFIVIDYDLLDYDKKKLYTNVFQTRTCSSTNFMRTYWYMRDYKTKGMNEKIEV
jgi:hypothetical protein